MDKSATTAAAEESGRLILRVVGPRDHAYNARMALVSEIGAAPEGTVGALYVDLGSDEARFALVRLYQSQGRMAHLLGAVYSADAETERQGVAAARAAALAVGLGAEDVDACIAQQRRPWAPPI